MGWARLVRVGQLALGLMVMGCGGDPGSPDAAVPIGDAADEVSDAPGPDAPRADGGNGADAGAAGQTRTTLGAAGGTARSADGLFEIIVEPGALAEDTEITITRMASGEVPADVVATEPLSAVYAVEPEGLVFGGAGAYAHFHWDDAPAALLDATGPTLVHGAALGLTRPASGGAIEPHLEPLTIHAEDGTVELYSRLAHLSLQWATRRVSLGGGGEVRFWAGFDFGASAHEVGDVWPHTTLVRSSVPLTEVAVRLWTLTARAGVEPHVQGTEPAVDPLPRWAPVGEGGRSLRLAPAGGLAAGIDHLVRPYPYWTCSDASADRIYALAGSEVGGVSVGVLVEAASECIEPALVDASVLETIECVRRGDAIDCSAAPVPTPTVLARPASTTTVNLADSPWFVILAPAAAPPAPGPATLTATNSGATMTATRSPTGSYDASIDTPLLWGPTAETRWSGPGGSSATTRGPDVAPPTWGTPGTSCDFSFSAEEPSWEIAVHPPPTVTCRGLDFVDAVVGQPAVVELGDGTRGFDAPIRDLLERTATYCEISPDALTGTGWYLELRASSGATLDAAGTRTSVRSGTALRIDGAALTASCPTGRTYCTDRCVDTASDPMNCGGCGLAPVEVCDGIDNDCDGDADEGCPIGITLPGAGDPVSSPMFGDTMSPTFGLASGGCMAMPMIGLCGSTNPDGTISTLDFVCGTPTVERRGIDAFEVVVTESLLGGISCEAGTAVPTGGAVWSSRCPSGTIVDGVSGLAPTTGRIGQVSVRCSQWTLVNDATRGWIVRRGTTAMGDPGGTGPGTPFAYTMPDRGSDGAPGMLRSRRARYQLGGTSIAGVYWISVAGNYPIVDLND